MTIKSKKKHLALSNDLKKNVFSHKKSLPDFIHLHVHSAFSLLEGALTVDNIIDLAKSDKQPAVAITDRNNLFSALEFSQKATKAGVQPIIGT